MTTETPPETAPGEAGAEAQAPARRTLLAGWGLIGWTLVLVAAVYCGWSGWSLWSETGDADRDPGRERDLVLRTGRNQVAVLNTMDHRGVEAGLRAWQDAATGPLRDQLARDAPQSRQKIAKARTGAAGTVVAAALTALDTRAGEARMIASVQIRLTPPAGAPVLQRKRYEAGLTRTPAGWRLKSLTAIPAGAR
ncbi:hypothetical protein ACIBF1_25680 [Spirillospora sp. NPDC050679]